MAPLGFSWADEVEREEQEELERAKRKENREEEEEEEKKQQPMRRADPFGAARPREVVLEEKGVDWRKIERELDVHSNRRSVATSSKKEHPRKNPQKRQNIEELVPPSRYPPKNIASLMEGIHKGQSDTSASNDAPFRHNLPINSAHSLVRVPQANVRMVELGHTRMSPNIRTLNPRHERGSNYKRKYAAATFTDDMENNRAVNSRKSYRYGSYYPDHANDIISRGNYNSIAAAEAVQSKRAILNDLNMERTNLRKNKRSGEAQAKRNSEFQGLMCQSVEPKMWLRQNYCRRRATSKGTEPSNQGNSARTMSPGMDNDSKNKVLISEAESGHRRRRHRNQTSK